MAPLSFSPEASISSHTLSAGSFQQHHPHPMESSSLSELTNYLTTTPLAFLQPKAPLQKSTLVAAKNSLDPVAAGLSAHQSQRLNALRKSRKRDYDGNFKPLLLRNIHLEGFGVDEVFRQTAKVYDASTEEIELGLPETQEGNDLEVFSDNADSEEGLDEEDDSSLQEDDAEWESEAGDDIDGEEISGLDSDAEDEEENDSEDGSDDGEPADVFKPDAFNLNDGFFDIDKFNQDTKWMEQADQNGEPISDDEDIDWATDPLGLGPKGPMQQPRDDFSEDSNDDEDEEDEEGPVFGDMSLTAPEGFSDEGESLDGDLEDQGEDPGNYFYKDFFAPPATATKKRNKKGRPHPHNFPSKSDSRNDEPTLEEDDVERTMSAVHRDLFEDDDDEEASEANMSDVDPADPKSRRSTHEKRQAKIAREIQRLEAANVAKRDWQLMGEAKSFDRPMNSLLEEDLDFERAGKPVPVITAEVSESIEELIKRRILNQEFDEIIRRRPDNLATGPVRRGQFELDDTKAAKGLAEIYEEEHLKQIDPNFVDARDEKLKKEHAEIEALWKSVSAKLDSLSSWHYKPKPAAPNLEIRVDAPAIEMEDARPTAGGDVAGASMLAPQELYKPGDEKNNAEVVTKSGMPVAREEMTREQKLRRRRREKERIKKANLNGPSATKDSANGKAKEKKEKEKKMIGDLKRGGVQVIGKRGALTDVEGREVKEKARSGAGSFKL